MAVPGTNHFEVKVFIATTVCRKERPATIHVSALGLIRRPVIQTGEHLVHRRAICNGTI